MFINTRLSSSIHVLCKNAHMLCLQWPSVCTNMDNVVLLGACCLHRSNKESFYVSGLKKLYVALCGCCAPFWATLLHFLTHQSSVFCHTGSLSCIVKGLLASQLQTQLWGPCAHPLWCIFTAEVSFEKRPEVWFFSPAVQFIILVVDSTDRERLAISKEELYRMLAHEVTRS